MELTAFDNLKFVEVLESPGDFSPKERAVLDRINDRVAAGNSLDEILNFLFDETESIMPCDRIGLSFLEEDGKRVAAHWARAKYEPLYLDKGYAADMEGSSLKEVLDSGRPRIIDDLGKYAESHTGSESTSLLLNEGVRSSMTCPLVVGNRPVGFLFRSSREPNSYSEREIRLHLAIAERLSQAVEKTWRIEQLTASNMAYLEMLGFISHELKSPIATIVMEGKLLTEGFLGQLDEQKADIVRKMIGQGERLLDLIRDYLDLARMEGGQLPFSPKAGVNFASDVIGPTLELVQTPMEQKGVKLIRLDEETRQVECDPNLLKIVLFNLLDNAVKYGLDGGEIRLSVKHEDEKLLVSVWNAGPGFPESEKQKLFRRFSRLHTPELMKRKGSGVGMYISWKIIQLHGGKIWAESEEGAWARFSFEIPQPIGNSETANELR